jgi:hypothetical protein
MGVTIATFFDGTVMEASAIMTMFTTIRDWQNGQIVAGDIVASSVPTRAFRRMEFYPDRSRALTGGTSSATVTTDPSSRTYATVDSHGQEVWADVSTLWRKILCEDDGTVEVVFEWWAWAIQSDQVNPEALNACDFRLVVGGTAVTDSQVTLFDCGTDATATLGGPFNYPARNFQAITQASVTAGWVTAKVQVKFPTYATRTNYSLVIIGAHNKHMEYWRL